MEKNNIKNQNIANMQNIEDAIISYINKGKRTDKQVEDYAVNLFCWYYPNATNDLYLKFKIYCSLFKSVTETKQIILNTLNGGAKC